jgi:hypothetical protein
MATKSTTIIIVAVILVVVLYLAVLSLFSRATTAELDAPFRLRAGYTATIPSEGLEVTFLNVTQDSRCPKDVQCVWSGLVVMDIKAVKDGQDLGTFNVSYFPSGKGELTRAGGYSIEPLEIEPDAVMGRKIRLFEYSVLLLVSRA